jgi:hypothetical protein
MTALQAQMRGYLARRQAGSRKNALSVIQKSFRSRFGSVRSGSHKPEAFGPSQIYETEVESRAAEPAEGNIAATTTEISRSIQSAVEATKKTESSTPPSPGKSPRRSFFQKSDGSSTRPRFSFFTRSNGAKKEEDKFREALDSSTVSSGHEKNIIVRTSKESGMASDVPDS